MEHSEVASRRVEDRVVTEEPLEIRVAAGGLAPTRAWVTMRTPGHDFELAAGWLVNESLAAAPAIDRVAYCSDSELADEQEFNVVTVTLSSGATLPHRHAAMSSGSSACGVCGKDSIEQALAVRPAAPWPGALPTADVVRDLPGRLRERQPLFARTGGAHAAALASAHGELLVVREDVGRHNAVDKVVGARVLAGVPVPEAVLVVSGRAGFELVQKAVTSGIGCLVAVGAPTALSVRLAREAGLGLWGFTGVGRTVQYA